MAENWRDRFKRAEQAYMVTKDQYAELARALGFEGDAWFGDPLASHKEVLERALSARAIADRHIDDSGAKQE